MSPRTPPEPVKYRTYPCENCREPMYLYWVWVREAHIPGKGDRLIAEFNPWRICAYCASRKWHRELKLRARVERVMEQNEPEPLRH